jgi:hypothetical protein
MDGEYGSLFAAVTDDQGRPWVELVERRPGRSWLVDRVQSLNDPGDGVAILRSGAAAPVADALALAGVRLLTPTTIDYGAACQDFYDRVTDLEPRLRHRSSTELDGGVNVAGRRRLEEGGWVWSPKRSTGHIDPLEAATLAAWAVARTVAPITIGAVHFR